MPEILMHKSDPVLLFEINPDTGKVEKIGKIFNPELIPVGVAASLEAEDPLNFGKWWDLRRIPCERRDIHELMELLNVASPSELLINSRALSLSDHYWKKRAGSDERWEDVNFFDHEFSADFGDYVFGLIDENDRIDFNTPDLTTQGRHKKRWLIEGGKRLLVKCGSPSLYQEPVNEIMASSIYKRLGIPHVPYTLDLSHREPMCVSENFISKDTEFVPALNIISAVRQRPNLSSWDQFLEASEFLEIPEARKSVEEMLVADFLIANQDRHTLNFGALRNADSLKFEGMAPIFDSGSSLSHDSVNICPSDRCMPFREWHEEQIRLVEDFSFLDFSALKGLCPHLGELLARSPWISAERGGALCHALQNRARLLKDTITEIKGQASLDLEPLRFKVY